MKKGKKVDIWNLMFSLSFDDCTAYIWLQNISTFNGLKQIYSVQKICSIICITYSYNTLSEKTNN